MGKVSSLEILNISNTQATARGFRALLKALRSNHTLRKLIADNNNLCSHNQVIGGNRSIVGASTLKEVISNNSSLTSLSLQHCHLTDSSGVPFGEGLRTNKGMNDFNLFGNDLGDKTMTQIAGALREGQQRLREFNLGKNFIGDLGGERLGDALAHNRGLLKFSLFHNNLTDRAAVAINKGLQANVAVEEINLGKNLINLRYIHMIDNRCKAIRDAKKKDDQNPQFMEKKAELRRVQGIRRETDAD